MKERKKESSTFIHVEYGKERGKIERIREKKDGEEDTGR